MSTRNLCSVHTSNQSDRQPGMFAQCILVISLIARNACSVHVSNQSDSQPGTYVQWQGTVLHVCVGTDWWGTYPLALMYVALDGPNACGLCIGAHFDSEFSLLVPRKCWRLFKIRPHRTTHISTALCALF